MTINIHPDPQEPAGGYAFLELPGGSLGDDPVGVAVMEVYGSRWLSPSQDPGGKVSVGDGNWQGERHDFGPYAVHAHDGADWVRIGPEIVNKIDEYTPLHLVVGAQEADVTWPDDVPPRAGAAVLGGLMSTARISQQEAEADLVGIPPEPEPEPEPETDPQLPEIAEDPKPAPVPAPKKNGLLWLLLILLLAAAGGGIWYFFLRQEKPVVSADTCTRSALVALDGFAATEKAIRACGDALSADTVLEIVEDAAKREDPDALLLFGTLYDGSELDQRIETVIGLSFEHDAAKAADYYARARAAGSDKARSRLMSTCAQLAGASGTLAKGAFNDFCH